MYHFLEMGIPKYSQHSVIRDFLTLMSYLILVIDLKCFYLQRFSIVFHISTCVKPKFRKESVRINILRKNDVHKVLIMLRTPYSFSSYLFMPNFFFLHGIGITTPF